MGKMFWIGILAIVTMIGSANAQEKPPRECGVSFPPKSGDCLFSYTAGDYVYISGDAWGVFDLGYCIIAGEIRVDAYAGTARASCSGSLVEVCRSACEAWSDQPAAEDGIGVCSVSGFGDAHGLCRSVTPEEAATLKDSGQGRVTKIPELGRSP